MSRLERLEALRDQITEWLEVGAADRAPLSARLMAVLKEIDELSQSAKVGDPVDEIAARRAARGGATARLGRS